jgi:hypothetical protein
MASEKRVCNELCEFSQMIRVNSCNSLRCLRRVAPQLTVECVALHSPSSLQRIRRILRMIRVNLSNSLQSVQAGTSSVLPSSSRICFVVRSTASGLRLIESIPCSTRKWANSGKSDGA